MAVNWKDEVETLKELMKAGKSNKEIAEFYGISKSYISTVLSRLRKKDLLPLRNEMEIKSKDYTEDKRQKMEINFKDKKKKEFDWKKFLHSAIDMQQQRKEKSISQDEAKIEITTDFPFAIAFSSDWHLGAEGVDYTSFLRHVDLITSVPNLFVGILGDLADNFVQSSKKGGMLSALFPPGDQQDVIKQIFEELGRNVIFKTSGNHDNWSFLEAGIDFAKYLYSQTNEAPYLREGGGIDLVVNDEIEYRIYAKHKYRYNSSFNLTHSVKRMFEQESPFDVGVLAHHHTPAIEQVSRWSGKYQRDIVCIRTGTYKIDDKWAKEQGYIGAQIGVPTVVFFPNEKRLIPFRRIEDAVVFLETIEGKWKDKEFDSKFIKK